MASLTSSISELSWQNYCTSKNCLTLFFFFLFRVNQILVRCCFLKGSSKSVVSNHILSVATFVRIWEKCSEFTIRNPFLNNCLSPHLNLLSPHVAIGNKVGQHGLNWEGSTIVWRHHMRHITIPTRTTVNRFSKISK